jgi:hypothetical protein
MSCRRRSQIAQFQKSCITLNMAVYSRLFVATIDSGVPRDRDATLPVISLVAAQH